MSKADNVFWRQFGVILILLTVFGFAMYFVANSIGGRAHAKMQSNPDVVAVRIAPVGRSRIGDPAGQTQAPAPAASTATQAAAPTSGTTAAASDVGAAGSAGQTVTAAAGPVDIAAGEQIYQSACFACHLSGVAEAPKLDDPAAWEPPVGPGHGGTPPVRHQRQGGDAPERRLCASDRRGCPQRGRVHARQGGGVGRRITLVRKVLRRPRPARQRGREPAAGRAQTATRFA